jgi:hypothetical protein
MARKSDTPGLQWRKRANGGRVPYWVARPDLIAKGFQPKSVRLHYDVSDPQQAAAIRSRCERLQAEMLAWARGDHPEAAAIYDGSLRRLAQLYETDENSPYRDLKQATARTYSKMLRLLLMRVGEVYVDELTGADVRRWFRHMSEPTSEGDRPRYGYAGLMISILKSVLAYGVNQGYDDCAKVRGQLAVARFHHAPARSTFMTYEQVRAFSDAAHQLKRPSAALWVTMQFELGLRRRDVIGEWLFDLSGNKIWRDGLTWGHITDGVMRKMVSKTARSTAREAVCRLADYPDLMAELDRLPPERRVGPIVINERSGLPYTPEQARALFRLVARAAGLPDDLWNMDVRAGAVTEAYESGATTEGAMALAAHTQPSTSRRYLRDTLEQSSRVAKLRTEGRSNKR